MRVLGLTCLALAGVTAAPVPAQPLDPLLPAPTLAEFSRQSLYPWSNEPGWQLLADHPAVPDVVAIGIAAEPYRDPWEMQNPSTDRRYRQLRDGAPRLIVRCVDGATEIVFEPRRIEAAQSYRNATGRNRSPAGVGPGAKPAPRDNFTEDQQLFLVFEDEDEEPILIETDSFIGTGATVHLDAPFDLLGKLRRQERLHVYLATDTSRRVSFRFGSTGDGFNPAATFHLEGLSDLLREIRDPCSWRAS